MLIWSQRFRWGSTATLNPARPIAWPSKKTTLCLHGCIEHLSHIVNKLTNLCQQLIQLQTTLGVLATLQAYVCSLKYILYTLLPSFPLPHSLQVHLTVAPAEASLPSSPPQGYQCSFYNGSIENTSYSLRAPFTDGACQLQQAQIDTFQGTHIGRLITWSIYIHHICAFCNGIYVLYVPCTNEELYMWVVYHQELKGRFYPYPMSPHFH